MGFFEDMKEGLVDPVHLVSDGEHEAMEDVGLDPRCLEDIEMFRRCGCCGKSECPHCSREEE